MQQKKKKPLIDDHSFVIGGRLPVVHSLNSNNLSKDGWGRDGNTYSKGDDIIVFDGIKYMLNGLVVQFMEDIKK